MWVKITGISMSPFLPDNLLVWLAVCQTTELRGGDIIIFKESDSFIAHRLINKIIRNKKWYLRTKGDISIRFDTLTNPKHLIGKVVAFKRWGILLPINNTLGRFIGLGFAYLTPIIYYLWTSLKRNGTSNAPPK
ncbi:MAG: S26 family signal peptidase [Planctomycetota bacterium]